MLGAAGEWNTATDRDVGETASRDRAEDVAESPSCFLKSVNGIEDEEYPPGIPGVGGDVIGVWKGSEGESEDRSEVSRRMLVEEFEESSVDCVPLLSLPVLSPPLPSSYHEVKTGSMTCISVGERL